MEILKELVKLYYLAKSIDVAHPLDRVALVNSIADLTEATESGDISDGYHTFNELYRYRKLYNAGFFNLLHKYNICPVTKSKKHADGNPCFDGNWFIVTAMLPTGQVGNHYRLEDWDLFDVPEVDSAPVWDGHSPEDATNRIEDWIRTEGKKKSRENKGHVDSILSKK